jgi:signal transduction histidine kinase
VSNRFVRNVKRPDRCGRFAYSGGVRATFWRLLAAAALVALLAVLATLQYRWLGEVSNAERDRLRAGLKTRTADFTDEFDRLITRLYVAFHIETDTFARDGAALLSDAVSSAESTAGVSGLVKGVFFLAARGPHTNEPLVLDPRTRTFARAAWPPALENWRRRADRIGHLEPGLPPPLFVAEAVDAETPALVVPLPALKRIQKGDDFAVLPDPAGVAGTVIVWLDADRLRSVVAALVAKHFGASDDSAYYVKIARRDDPADVIYAPPAGAQVDAASADLASGMFDLRFDDFTRFNLPVPQDAKERKNRLAITIVRRTSGARQLFAAGGDSHGAWQVLVRSRSGSLDTLVAQSRRRNLAIGLGVLALLGVSFAFVVASAQRQQRLARQQMEFVAAVSHELRTPLAVIRSAGENLADGLVADADQVRRYGSLVRTEGRRLSEMVERVLEFAGVTSGTAARPHLEVDLARVVSEAVEAVAADARDRAVTIAARVDRALPATSGDADALRSAVQNVVGNAIKYSASGASIDVLVDVHGSRVRIVVADRGLGIDAADLPHVFKPFYRGRRAVDAQIRGTGVGLSVVRHVVDAHRGDVSIDSRPGEGTTVTIALPAIAAREPVAAEARATT